ncbi:MAG: hypothetical protein GY823_02375 [Flavobacteriaceae bacterium]|nr:hypothetical protein [Flavobacteriaceae bacterium]
MSKYNLIDIYEQYQIGSGWTSDFDYDGMLKTGLGTSIDTPIEVLKKISDDFEDVNYHRENMHLSYAIDAIEIGDMMEAESRLNDFHKEIKKTMGEQDMDIEPTLGKFMASKMEEGEEVKEVTSREGSRIEGLLSQPLKSKFLNAFDELYFDLVEEDPFHAEDVIEHLSIEMMKHLDAIQAQGEKLAGVGNPSVEFTPGERIGEETVDEGDSIPSTKDIVKALKSANAQDSEIKQYMTSLKKAGDKFDDVDDYVEDFNNYVADKGLAEHFGRFMKDYQ